MPISIFQSRCLQDATARTAGACLSSPETRVTDGYTFSKSTLSMAG
ncbi:hypothetical protein OAG10_00985 [Verrucomicrobia bacterium]|nr:hypothetical protein [Verrucomicrobiota bacterium]